MKSNFRPNSEQEFSYGLAKEILSYTHCVSCKQAFSDANVQTAMGWRETQISGMCEKCYDELFTGDDIDE